MHHLITMHARIWTHFGEVWGNARPWLMARWNARLSIRLNWTYFAVCYGSGVMGRNVYSWAVFAGGRPLCTQILHGYGRPSAIILGIRILDTLGYSTVKTASLCVPSFWHNTGVWRTDGRICRSTYSACKASFAERCKNKENSKMNQFEVSRLKYRVLRRHLKEWTDGAFLTDSGRVFQTVGPSMDNSPSLNWVRGMM